MTRQHSRVQKSSILGFALGNVGGVGSVWDVVEAVRVLMKVQVDKIMTDRSPVLTH
jgi:hypothetical protein